MDKLAVELVTLISFFACTDGGSTGCALSLVSKRVHYASRPARFYSVSLINSPIQIEEFLVTYEQERKRTTDVVPRVRHLCLSFFGRGLDTKPNAAPLSQLNETAPRPTSREAFLAQQRQRAQHMSFAQNNMDGFFNRVIPALIRTVAPDLETLSLIQAQWRSASILRIQFPCLRELTLVGGDPSFLPFSFMPRDRPLYPALKRLHHIQSHVNKDIDFLQWAHHAPNLTHLRVSRMDYYPRITVDTLEQVMSPSAPPDAFPHLERVIIQPHPGPPPSTSGRMSTIELSFRDFLAHLRKAAEKARVPVLLLPAAPVPKGMLGPDPSRGCILKLQEVWMARIEGAEAVWIDKVLAEPQSDNNASSSSNNNNGSSEGACWTN